MRSGVLVGPSFIDTLALIPFTSRTSTTPSTSKHPPRSAVNQATGHSRDNRLLNSLSQLALPHSAATAVAQWRAAKRKGQNTARNMRHVFPPADCPHSGRETSNTQRPCRAVLNCRVSIAAHSCRVSVVRTHRGQHTAPECRRRRRDKQVVQPR